MGVAPSKCLLAAKRRLVFSESIASFLHSSCGVTVKMDLSNESSGLPSSFSCHKVHDVLSFVRSHRGIGSILQESTHKTIVSDRVCHQVPETDSWSVAVVAVPTVYCCSDVREGQYSIEGQGFAFYAFTQDAKIFVRHIAHVRKSFHQSL